MNIHGSQHRAGPERRDERAFGRACGRRRGAAALALLWVFVLSVFSLAPFVSPGAAAEPVRLLGMRVQPVQGGVRVELRVSRALSFDAGVQAAPLRLDLLAPGLQGGSLKVSGQSPLLGQPDLRAVPGGVLLTLPLRAPALIVDAHAEPAAAERPARLVVRLARTDAPTLARLLGVKESELAERRRASSPATSEQARRTPSGAPDKVKQAYRRLVEEAAGVADAPSGIGRLIAALPLDFGNDDAAAKSGTAGQKKQRTASGNAHRKREEHGERDARNARNARNGDGAAAGQRPVVVIDAGHGGHDPGALGVGGVKEKDIVLRFAHALRQALEKRGYSVVMTREGDTFLRLRERVAVARDHGAALFISIHADRFRTRGVGGLGIYTLSEQASDEDAAALARKENAADLIGAPQDAVEDDEVRDILVELTQRETNANSHLLATRLVRGLRGVARLRRNPVRSAAFRVLRAPEIPALLVELGFITNRRDVRNMLSRAWRRKVAARMAETIDKVLKNRLALR